MNSVELLTKILSEHEITQNQLAKILLVSDTNISRWKNGVYPLPLRVACLISYHFGIPLEEAIDYDRVIAPYTKTIARYSKNKDSSAVYHEQDESKRYQNVLAIAEDLQAFNISYSELMMDASLQVYELDIESSDLNFRKGDLLFYKNEPPYQKGYALYMDAQKQTQVVYLKQQGRELFLQALDIKAELIRYGKEARGKGQILGKILYLVRRCEDL